MHLLLSAVTRMGMLVRAQRGRIQREIIGAQLIDSILILMGLVGLQGGMRSHAECYLLRRLAHQRTLSRETPARRLSLLEQHAV
jgi:hypothetical protein